MLFKGDYRVPLTGIEQGLSGGLIISTVGLIGSIVTAYLFPRIFAPLFIKVKNKVFFRYDDAYIKKESTALTPKRFLIRGIYLVLLLLGLLAFILPLVNEYTIHLWLSEDSINMFESEGVIPCYSPPVIVTHIGLLLPIVVGIWSIGWAMEDAGLMHYKFDDRKGYELYEIEPVHVKYTSYVKGYAGITSILFFIELIIIWAEILPNYPERVTELILVLILPFIAMVVIIPAYIIFTRTSLDFLKKDLPELKELKKDDIIKS